MKQVVNIDAGAMCGCTTSADFICGDLPHIRRQELWVALGGLPMTSVCR